MGEKKKVDPQEIANILTRDGFRVASFEWIGDPEKLRDIFARLGRDCSTLGVGLPPEERKRLENERIGQAMKELEEGGIDLETLPLFGTWPLSSAEDD